MVTTLRHMESEEKIIEICDIIHKQGGQVYMEVNLNALVGVAKPGKFGQMFVT